MTLKLALPDIDLQTLGKNEAEIRLDLAVFCFVAWGLPAGRCADYAGISKIAFMDELGKRKIPQRYGLAELNQDALNWEAFLHDRRQ